MSFRKASHGICFNCIAFKSDNCYFRKVESRKGLGTIKRSIMPDEGPKMKPPGIPGTAVLLNNKQAPAICEDAVSYALRFFPELKGVPIQFYHKPSVLPHKSRLSFASIFKKPGNKRQYKVTVSAKTVPELSDLTFDNLSFNAQVGMIAHELAHITQFQQKTPFQLLKSGFSYLMRPHRLRLEQEADKMAVQRGLGWELYAFATTVERVASTGNPVVSYLSQFHLSPEEIIQYMQNLRRSSKIDFLIDFSNCLN